MKKFLALAVVGLALAGCIVKPSTDASVPVAVSPTDAKIAELSKKLAAQCTLLAVGIAAADAFIADPKVQKVVDSAEIARADFCASPPSDATTAIAKVAQIAIDITVALKQAKAS